MLHYSGRCQERTFALLQSPNAQGHRRPSRGPPRADHRGGDDPVRGGRLPLDRDGRGHAATGLSAGAVYRYFPSKEALIRAIVEERVLATAAAAFEHILDEGVDDPIEAISAALGIVDAVSARQGVDLTRVAVQAWGEALRNPVILDVAQGAYAKMRGYLAAVARRAQEHGRMPADADPDEVAKTLLSLVMGYLIQRLIMGDVDRESYTTALRALTALGMPAASAS